MAVDSPATSPSAEQDVWVSPDDLPKSRQRSGGSRAEELREKMRKNEGMYLLVESDTINATTVYRMFSEQLSGPGFQVKAVLKGKRPHTIERDGPRKGEIVERSVYDVYVRYDSTFKRAPRAKSGDGAAPKAKPKAFTPGS